MSRTALLPGRGCCLALLAIAVFGIGAAHRASGQDTKPVIPLADSVRLIKATPPAGTHLMRGNPVPIDVEVEYDLVSQDEALLEISIGEMPADVPDCKTKKRGQLTDASNSVPITRGTHQLAFELSWSGDTGAKSKGVVYHTGYIALYPISTTTGKTGKKSKGFGMLAGSCYPFGP